MKILHHLVNCIMSITLVLLVLNLLFNVDEYLVTLFILYAYLALICLLGIYLNNTKIS